MNPKSVLVLNLKILFLTLLMFILFIVGTQLAGIDSAEQMSKNAAEATAEEGIVALILLFVCLIDVLILVWLILSSRFTGFYLILITALVYYSVKTVMSQMEAWYFMVNITPDMLPKLFLMTVPIALFFPLIAVPLLGKFKRNNKLEEPGNNPLIMSYGMWIWKTALLAVIIYPLLYFLFGYFIAWQSPELRAFYQGTDPRSFFSHMANVFGNNPGLYFFQVFRGLLWIGLALIIIQSVKKSAFKMGLLTAALFSLLMNDGLLLPNSLMPDNIRWTHLIETATSNFIWGWSVVAVMLWHPKQSEHPVAEQ